MSVSAGLLFYFCAFIAVGTAVATVMMANPLRSAVALLGHIISLAGLYLTLNAHLLAAIQLIVYAGAVVVLFVFTIMLIGPESEIPHSQRNVGVRIAALAVTLLLTFGGIFALTQVEMVRPAVTSVCADGLAECGQFGGLKGLGRVLYTDAVVPFELVSILLLVAIVGAIAFASGRSPAQIAKAKAAREEREAADRARLEQERKVSAEVAAHGGH